MSQKMSQAFFEYTFSFNSLLLINTSTRSPPSIAKTIAQQTLSVYHIAATDPRLGD